MASRSEGTQATPVEVPGAPRDSNGLTGEVGQEPGVAVDLVEQNVAAEFIRV